MQKGFGDWLASASYLGNRTVHLWRATELNPAVPIAGATTGNTNQRRVLFLQDPVDGQAYGTIGHVDDTGRGNYHGLLLTLQKRMANNLSVLSNWTISRCMSDPATSEITGPTIVDPNNPDLDYGYCSSDRRHVVNLSAVVRTPDFEGGLTKALFSDWMISPIVRWQSGNRSSVTTGIDNALTGMGGQRAVQILDDPYGDGSDRQLPEPRPLSPARRPAPTATWRRSRSSTPRASRTTSRSPGRSGLARARCRRGGRSSTSSIT